MISVVIPTYKNRTQLYRNIAHNLPFLAQCEVVIVNDYPGESIRQGLPKGDIMLIENELNLGFAGAVDTGIRRTNNRYVMLLNSDVLLKDSSYLTAFNRIRDDHSLFAVSFAQEEKNGTIVGKNEIYWENGFVHHRPARDLKEGENAWAEGGACIIDKKKYLGLDGFDRIYSPYYWEDVDLSYRAWKSGYRILFEPGVVVEHHHESTIGKYFSSDTVKTTAYRNQLLFMWKNITEKPLVNEHVRALTRMLPGMVFKDRVLFKGFMRALARLPAARSRQRTYAMTDRQILDKFL